MGVYKTMVWGLPWGPVAEILRSQCPGSTPRQGTGSLTPQLSFCAAMKIDNPACCS